MAFSGLDMTTGRPIDGIAHLRQSVGDILSTPLGSRVMRRDYGSELPRLVDRNVDPLTIARLYAATAKAIATFEPRLAIDRIELTGVQGDIGSDGTTLGPGQVELELVGTYLPDGRPVTLSGVVT